MLASCNLSWQKDPSMPQSHCSSSEWNGDARSTTNGPLDRYVKLRVTHALGMPGMFSLSPRVSDPDMHHGTCGMHLPWCIPGSLTCGFLWSWRRGKRSRHSRCMRNPQFYISGKRHIVWYYDYTTIRQRSAQLYDFKGGGAVALKRRSRRMIFFINASRLIDWIKIQNCFKVNSYGSVVCIFSYVQEVSMLPFWYWERNMSRKLAHYHVYQFGRSLGYHAMSGHGIDYRKTSGISRIKSPNLNVSCLALQLPLPNPFKPCVKLRTKM